jgi:hypothetical protein
MCSRPCRLCRWVAIIVQALIPLVACSTAWEQMAGMRVAQLPQVCSLSSTPMPARSSSLMKQERHIFNTGIQELKFIDFSHLVSGVSGTNTLNILSKKIPKLSRTKETSLCFSQNFAKDWICRIVNR